MNITDPIRERARADPNAVAAIRPHGGAVGYAALDRSIDAVARRMVAKGVGPGDFVVILPLPMGGYPDLVLRLALARIGAASAPASLPAQRAKAVIARAAGDAPSHPSVMVAEWGWFDDPPLDGAPVNSFDDGAAIMGLFTTSGTTGKARLIPVTHDMMAARVASANGGVPTRAPVRQITVPTVRSGFGFLSLLRVLWAGGTIVTAPARPEDIVDLVRRHRVDRLVLLPFWVPHLVAALPPGDRPLPSLEQIEFGGSELPAPVLELARARLCDELWNVYGVTEGGFVATGRHGTLDHAAGEAGSVVPGVEVRAFDADGKPAAPGVEGRLRMRGPGFVTSYFDDPERSAESFRDGWFEPGDMGSVTASGVVRVRGRESELMNVGGYKVHPRAVERALSALDWVRDVAVFGFPDENGLVQIAAAVVPARRIDARDIDALRSHGEAMPSILMPVPELPRNENGKVRRDELFAIAIANRRDATKL